MPLNQQGRLVRCQFVDQRLRRRGDCFFNGLLVRVGAFAGEHVEPGWRRFANLDEPARQPSHGRLVGDNLSQDVVKKLHRRRKFRIAFRRAMHGAGRRRALCFHGRPFFTVTTIAPLLQHLHDRAFPDAAEL